MSKESILKDLYEANIDGRIGHGTRAARVRRTTQGNQTVRDFSGGKRRSLPLMLSVFGLGSLIVSVLNGVAGEGPVASLAQRSFASNRGAVVPVQSRSSSFAFAEMDFADLSAKSTTRSREDAWRPNTLGYRAWSQDPEVSIAELFGLGVKTIVIDPGHGGRDPGAIGPGGLKEKKVTMDLARRLRDRLVRHRGYRVLLTRETDTTLSLRERVDFANDNQADLFISLHVNSLPVEKPTVVETYYFGPQSDEAAKTIAQRENQDSDYSMGEFRQMIAQIGDSLKQQESKKLAASIQQKLYTNLKKHKPSIDSWGIKTAPFVVLLGGDMPSVLAEVTTLSNGVEEKNLKTEPYRERIAAYLEQGITAYLESINTSRDRLVGGNENGGNAGNS